MVVRRNRQAQPTNLPRPHAGTTNCSTVCATSLGWNELHCGSCHNACPANAFCNKGVCQCGSGASCTYPCVSPAALRSSCLPAEDPSLAGLVFKCQFWVPARRSRLLECRPTCQSSAMHASTPKGQWPCTQPPSNSAPAGRTNCTSNGVTTCPALLTDEKQCGSCGNACTPGLICKEGVCKCSLGEPAMPGPPIYQCAGCCLSRNPNGICYIYPASFGQ
jgi:hypothetical protein